MIVPVTMSWAELMGGPPRSKPPSTSRRCPPSAHPVVRGADHVKGRARGVDGAAATCRGYSEHMPVTLLGASEIRALAAELDVTPTKKLGQNFVVDANTVRRIVQVARVQPGESVVEVGPGLGSLTLAILEAGRVRHRRRDRPPTGRAPARGRPPRTVSPDGAARGRRRRCTARDRAARRPDRPGREPAVQRLGARAAALPRDLPAPAARRRDGAGGGGRTARGAAGVQDLRRAEREGRLVRPVAAGRHRVASGVLAGAERRQRARRVHRATPQPRGTEAERMRTFQIVDAAFQQRRKMLRQAVSGVLGGIGGRGIRGPGSARESPRPHAARSSASTSSSRIARRLP